MEGKVVFVVDFVIGLRQAVIAEAKLWDGAAVIGGCSGPGQNTAGPQGCEQFVADETILHHAELGHFSLRDLHVSSGGLGSLAWQANGESLFFEGSEKEKAVLLNRPAKRKTIVVVTIALLVSNEGRLCRECLITVIVVHGSVQIVSAGLQRQVHVTACASAVLRSCLGLHGKLVYGICRQDDSGDSADPTLVDRRNVPPQIVVIHAVHLPVNLVPAGPVH